MKADIEHQIKEVLTQLGAHEVSFVVEHPADVTHGDYATNAALAAAKQLGKAPREVAELLVADLTGKIAGVAEISIAGPGFINFTLDRAFFTAITASVLGNMEGWGMGQSLVGQRYVVEYTDPNPFKEFHIGHMFTNAVGESIARLCMAAGAEVKRVCYQGDVGLHVAHAIWGMQQLGITADSEFTARDLGRAYATGATAYKENETAQAEIAALNKVIYERTDDVINELYDTGRTVSLAYFETIYARLGTSFAEYFFESEAAPRGKELVLSRPDVFIESEGARIFVGEDHGLHTRVFINKLGLPTYEAKELALAKMKEERLGGYDHSIVSTAKEINEYFKVLLCAMGFVYPDLAAKTEHIGHGMVRLTTGKMSSRTGDVIAALDFLDDVAASARERIVAAGVAEPTPELVDMIAVGAIKYATLKGNITQDSIFDKDKALSFEGDSGPYLQYTYARIKSVLDKAALHGVTPGTTAVPVEPYALERILYRFPMVVEGALVERTPHQVTTYLTELASAFNSFYAHEKIADASDEFAPYKAALAAAVGQTLKRGLWVLGIKTPERM